MKKMMQELKNLIFTSLLLIGTLSIFGFSAHASENGFVKVSGDFRYIEKDEGIALTEFHGSGVSDVTIPAEVDGKKVVELREGLFRDGDSIKRITLEEGITEILAGVLEGCKNAEEISLPASLRDIEMSDRTAFDGCDNLKNITVKDGNPAYYAKAGVLFQKSPKSLYYYPSGKKQKTYQVPEGIKWIGTFGYSSSLEKIILPKSASVLGHQCFMRPQNLKQVVASEGIKKLVGEDQFGFSRKLQIVAYPKSFLWNYAKKTGLRCLKRSIKKPTEIKLGKTNTGIRISWKKNEDAGGYAIYRGTDKKGKFEKLKENKKASAVNWIDKTAKKGQKYFYKVRVYRVVAKRKLFSKYSKVVGMER